MESTQSSYFDNNMIIRRFNAESNDKSMIDEPFQATKISLRLILNSKKRSVFEQIHKPKKANNTKEIMKIKTKTYTKTKVKKSKV